MAIAQPLIRSVPTRPLEFDAWLDDLPKYFAADDAIVMSHVLAVLSSVFPDGEDYFVRSVEAVRDRIDDPRLRRDVDGFIGQESMHGREHRVLNERLAELGYPTRAIGTYVRRVTAFRERVSGQKGNLAFTAALEHYTATLAQVLLTDPEARAMFDVDEVRAMFIWHALEESEHKAVAFDVFEAVSGSYLIRVGVMQAITFGFILSVAGHTAQSMVLDPAARDLGRLGRSLARLRHSPWLKPEVLAQLLAYSRRGFHPDDRDTSDLIAHWRAELFGTDGPLADRLQHAG